MEEPEDPMGKSKRKIDTCRRMTITGAAFLANVGNWLSHYQKGADQHTDLRNKQHSRPTVQRSEALVKNFPCLCLTLSRRQISSITLFLLISLYSILNAILVPSL